MESFIPMTCPQRPLCTVSATAQNYPPTLRKFTHSRISAIFANVRPISKNQYHYLAFPPLSSLFFLDDIRHLSLVTQTRPSRRDTSSTMIYHDLSDSHRHSLYDHSPRPSQVTGFCNGFQMTSESYVANHKLCAVLFDQ